MKAISSEPLSATWHSILPDGTRCGYCLALLSEGLGADTGFYHHDCWAWVLASQGQPAGVLLRDGLPEALSAAHPRQGQPAILRHPWLRG